MHFLQNGDIHVLDIAPIKIIRYFNKEFIIRQGCYVLDRACLHNDAAFGILVNDHMENLGSTFVLCITVAVPTGSLPSSSFPRQDRVLR